MAVFENPMGGGQEDGQLGGRPGRQEVSSNSHSKV